MSQLFEFVGNHPILVGIFAVLLTLFIRNETQRGGRGVSPQELVNLVNKEGAVVLDVRDSKEFAAGHIVDAVNVPHTSLESRLAELEKYKEKPVTIVCKMGQHAGTAGAMLRKAGFASVSRLSGGMTEWRNQNLPVVKGS
jgi:rhodanese-related sulfurtransferase